MICIKLGNAQWQMLSLNVGRLLFIIFKTGIDDFFNSENLQLNKSKITLLKKVWGAGEIICQVLVAGFISVLALRA